MWSIDNESVKHDTKEKYELLLNQACATYRFNKKYGSAMINKAHLENKILPIDIELAEKIKTHYKGKLTSLILLGRGLTPFRKDLRKFLIDGETSEFSDIIPLVNSLPSLYEYDMAFDNMIHQHFPEVGKSEYKRERQYEYTSKLDLKPIGKLKKKRKSMSEKTEYWFKSMSSKFPYCIVIDSNNPLLFLWDKQYTNNDFMPFETYLELRQRDGTSYYKLEKFQIISHG